MKIKYMACPRCGGEINAADLNKVNYCSYCGAPLYIDDGTTRSVNTTIIRDEARIKEAENAARRIELEEQRYRNEQAHTEIVKEERADRMMKAGGMLAGAAVFAFGSLLKAGICIAGIILMLIIGLFYLISPMDFVSGLIIDDIIVIYFCLKAISAIGGWMKRGDS